MLIAPEREKLKAVRNILRFDRWFIKWKFGNEKQRKDFACLSSALLDVLVYKFNLPGMVREKFSSLTPCLLVFEFKNKNSRRVPVFLTNSIKILYDAFLPSNKETSMKKFDH